MQIAILLFDGVVALDAIGPYDVLKLMPGADVRLVAASAGEVATDGPLKLVADDALDDVPRPDVVVVPGGPARSRASRDERLLAWLRDAHEHTRYTASVCWGSELLGAAGLLDGVRATSHWLVRDELAAPRRDRRRRARRRRAAGSSRRPASRPASTWRCGSPR